MRVVTLSSIWWRFASRSRFALRSCSLSLRRAWTSAVMAATFAVSVLMVSAGLSASGAGAWGTVSMTSASFGSPLQDFR
jgi:hypothetical protein